jgi:hypothetical protein
VERQRFVTKQPLVRRPAVILWSAAAAWVSVLFTLGAYHRTRGEPSPNDDVVVCENYEVCQTRPVRIVDVDPFAWPVCDEEAVMNVRIKYRDWPHRWR